MTSHIELSRQLAEKQVMHERQLLVQMQKLTARVEASEAALRAEHERPLGVVDTGMPFDVGYGKPMSLASLASADPTKLAGVSDTASVTPSDSASHAELMASHAEVMWKKVSYQYQAICVIGVLLEGAEPLGVGSAFVIDGGRRLLCSCGHLLAYMYELVESGLP